MMWPVELCPSTNGFELVSNSREYKSPYTGVRQAVALPGRHWVIELELRDLLDSEARTLEVLTDDLNGQVETIKIMDHARLGEPAKGTPQVAASGESGRSLRTKGWQPSTVVLKKGDLITVNDELKRLREDVTSSASGLATLTFNPPLRKPPALNAPIITHNPYMVANLSTKSAQFKRVPGIRQNVTLKFIEAIHR